MDIDKLLRFAVQQGASDLHLQADAPPMLRLAGEPRFVETPPLTREDLAHAVAAIAPKGAAASLDGASFDAASFDAAVTQGLDFSYVIDGLSRFSCSAYRTLGALAIV